MFVEQSRTACRVWCRGKDGAWSDAIVSDPAARLDLPVIGDIATLADLYRHTPLWQG